MNPSPATFESLGLGPELAAQLAEDGYEHPTPIQSEAIPLLLSGKDLLGQAATGTGKTAAFALPIVHALSEAQLPERGRHDVRALILAPTRELAAQVARAVKGYGKRLNISVTEVCGGQPIMHQIRDLRRGTDIVVATPGRAVDLINRGALQLEMVSTFVMDEADEMLDMGFAEDIEAIAEALPENHQRVLFSATMPTVTQRLAEKLLTNPALVNVISEDRTASTATVIERAYLVPRSHRDAALRHVLNLENPSTAILFCKTREDVDQTALALSQAGYRAEALHGGLDQGQRDRVMNRLRRSETHLLVATDVAARGLDIDHLTHVINVDLPVNSEVYIHRIGRIGRAGRDGVAITMVDERQQRRLKNIERESGRKIERALIPSASERNSRRTNQLVASLRELLVAAFPDEAVLDDAVLDNAVLDEPVLDNAGLDNAGLDGATVDELEAVGIAYDETARDETAHAEAGHDEPKPDAPKSDEPKTKAAKPAKSAKSAKAKKIGPAGLVHDDIDALVEQYGAGNVVAAALSLADAAAEPEADDLPHMSWQSGAAARQRPDRSPRSGGASSGGGSRRPTNGNLTKVFVSIGERQGIRRGDLVGAITGEAGLRGDQLGAIHLGSNFATVEVPADAAQRVISALKATKIRNQEFNVRLDRAGSGPRHGHAQPASRPARRPQKRTER